MVMPLDSITKPLMICSALLLSVFLLLAPYEVFPNPATDEQMAKEAIDPFVPRNPDLRKKVLKEHFNKIEELARSSPEEIRPATAYFKTGLSVAELHDLREKYNVEVIDLMVKAPQGDGGSIMSMQLGMQDLFAIDGPFKERLSFVIDKHQECFKKSSRHMPPGETEEWAQLASRPFLAYSVRAFGSMESLRGLQEEASVLGVLLNVDLSAMAEFNRAKSTAGPSPYTMPGFLC